MNTPALLADISSYDDIEKLVHNGVPEDLHLEYKSGRPKDINHFKDDIAQDVSAFANSDGGTLIVGVSERDSKPFEIDGVDESKLSREALGQVIVSKVRPIIAGLRITLLTGQPGKAVLVISVPKSDEAPHQGPR